MCGHLGFSFKQAHPNTPAMMAAMGIFMDNRGGHSWGYWADNLPITKGMGKISEEHPAVNWAGSKRVIAHCRWATHGEKKVENSHPFVQGDVIGAHNGVIVNHEDLCKEYGREFDVDSQHIFQHINDGLDMTELKGYGTIVWTRLSDLETINFCVFNNGSFAVAEVWEGEVENSPFLGTVWASTETALKVGLKQAGFGYKEIKVKEDYRHFVGADFKVYIDENTKIDIGWASKWSPKKAEVVTTVNSVVPFQGSPYGRGGYVRTQPTLQDGATDEADTDEAWANRLVEIAENAHRKTTNLEMVGKDIDEVVRSVWRGSGVFYHKGKCFGCDEKVEVVRHKELGVRMCYDCTFEWEDLNSDPNTPAEVIKQSFITMVADKRKVKVELVWAGVEKAKKHIITPDNIYQGRFEVLETSDGPIIGSRVQTAEALN